MRSDSLSLGLERTQKPRSSQPWTLLLYVLLVLVCLPFVLPILWMFLSSLKSAQGIFGSPFSLNVDAGLKNFAQIFANYPFARQYLNSLLTLAISVPVTLLLAATAGYAFARMRFPGRDLAFVMTLAAMMVPAELVAIPQFIAFRNLGLANTLVPIMLLQIFSATGALSVFLMRQHFITLPRELEEAGRIDGLGTLGVFRYIMLPLSRPVLATVAIFAVLNSWNDYFNPLIYLNDEAKMTLPLALQRFTDPLGGTYWNLTLAASVLVALPVLLAFLMAQRTFIESLAASGTKG
ncbi:L-arabinose transport system permease protein AraQ [Deinococcus carri]|uniref:L-arabinose transport system permease protein AraQ n=1 Tax=Deinococcus carri TaxID=1211323 RepID=A0ABP9WCH8_9DEIO